VAEFTLKRSLAVFRVGGGGGFYAVVVQCVVVSCASDMSL